MNITFDELRQIKDSLPDGTVQEISEKLNISPETVRNYFGGANYESGEAVDLHFEPGPGGGIVHIEDTTILDMARSLIERDAGGSSEEKEQPSTEAGE